MTVETNSGGKILVWPEIAVTADIIALRKRQDFELQPGGIDSKPGDSPVSLSGLSGYFEVLLIKRRYPPFENSWALPGGGVESSEDLVDAARRELMEETGLVAEDLRQFKTYGTPGRDPRCRVVSVIFWTILGLAGSQHAAAGSDAKETGWFPLSSLPPLAFDHAKILEDLSNAVFGQQLR